MYLAATLITACSSNPATDQLSDTVARAATTTPLRVDPSPRPLALIEALPGSELKNKLQSCASGPFERTEFSISHRGAPLGYPEHTRQGYVAAAAMGAGVIECDVTFTKDLALVCRHSQCDLHRTTNILQTGLAGQCSEGFTPAADSEPASARCCTSDITLAEFRSLCGRRDIVDNTAISIDAYLSAPVPELVESPVTCGELMTHAESIELIGELGSAFTPELKAPMVEMPFQGMSQQDYASRMLAEYRNAGIAPERVKPQSFVIEDILYWVDAHPEFATGAVYLDPRGRQADFQPSLAGMQALKQAGITTVAPPMPMLLTLDGDGELQPSEYARHATAAGLDIITWTFESGGATDPDNWLYANLPGYMTDEARMLEVLHALHDKVGIKGIFSDWPGTITYYANCFGLD